MQTSTALVLGGVIGAVLCGLTVLAWRLSERSAQAAAPAAAEPLVPPGAAAVLSVLRSSAMIVGPDDAVLKASAPAHMLGLVRGSRLAVPELLDLVRRVRRDGQIREVELEVPRAVGGPATVAARIAPLGVSLVLLLAEDRTRERRVEAIRRDFVANVSHELKTPVGALNLLAEAVAEAADDPDSVIRFASRMRRESDRLERLVQQIIELSRLQGDDSLVSAERVSVDEITEAALDRVRVDAEAKSVAFAVGGERECEVRGDEAQLSAALGNLVENAVAYSPPGSVVTVRVGHEGRMVRISVSDHGAGIPARALDRIFERFYRLDPARARETGGTGLGLSIVKHVAATHGGEVVVESVEGEGSTFTLALPAAETAVAATSPEAQSLSAEQAPQGRAHSADTGRVASEIESTSARRAL